MKYHLFILLGICFLSFTQLYALPQEGADSTAVAEEDIQNSFAEDDNTSSNIDFQPPEAPVIEDKRKVDANKWNELLNKKEFKYPEEKVKVEEEKQNTENWISRFFSEIFAFFKSDAGSVVIWLFVATLLVFVVYRIFIANDSLLFSKKDKKRNVNEDELSDDYEPEDWDAAIQSAIDNKNWRLAVRHSYRYTIKLMGEHAVLQIAPAKTNYQYVNEILGSQWHQSFLRMTRHYEFAWYGGFELQQQQFDQYYHLFTDIKKGLTT